MEREVRYCTTEDGVRIAYCVEGEGPPLFLLQFFVESFFLLPSLRPEWETFLQELALGRTLVRCDARGTGLSQREVNDSSHDALVRDMEAVVAAVKMKRFAIFAQTSSMPRAIEYTARQAQQVTHLILAGGFPRLTDVMPPQNLDSFAQLARFNWTLGALGLNH